MRTASVSETKNNLSAILRQVREGESYLIVDRGKPVARLGPVSSEEKGADQRRADLEQRGILRRGRGRIVQEILDTPPPRLPKNVSALALLLEERETGR
jgi:prevent-host-death family protein